MPVSGGAIDVDLQALGLETDSQAGAGYFSVQLNTNAFTAANGHQAAVQFTDMHSPESAINPGDVLCIWNVDINAQDYHTQCHAPLMGRAPISGDHAVVQGYQDFQEAGYLKMVVQVSWDPQQLTYGVVAPDMYGLTQSSVYPGKTAPAGNINGNWTQLSGSILGYGNGSTAEFSKSNVWIALDVWNCQFDANMDCVGWNPGFWSWAKTKPSVTVSWLTQEQNNLAPVTTFLPTTPASVLPALQCPSWNGCFIEYNATAP